MRSVHWLLVPTSVRLAQDLCLNIMLKIVKELSALLLVDLVGDDDSCRH